MRIAFLSALAYGLTLAVTTQLRAAETGPSFDCAKAATPVEKTLCADGNGSLAALDRALGRMFAALKAQGGFDDILATQSAWLKKRDACATKVDCLTTAYSARLSELAAAGGDKQGISGAYSYSASKTDNGQAWIVRELDGTLSGGIESVASDAFHTCSISFKNAQPMGDAWLWQPPADEDASCRVLFRAGKRTLRIDSLSCQYYCGARGYFDQTYKRQ